MEERSLFSDVLHHPSPGFALGERLASMFPDRHRIETSQSFDVFSFDGREWSLASSFSMSQKEEAIKFAQRMFARTQIKGVRIIQETFDRELGGSARKPLLMRVKDEHGNTNAMAELEAKLVSA